MSKRCQSPSSINTYKQCPRKYFYQYKLKLPTSPSIHTVRGNVVHSVLEDFFDIPLGGLNMDNFEPILHQHSQRLLVHHWKKADPKLKSLDMDQEELRHFFEESNLMLMNWINRFAAKVHNHPGNFVESFNDLTPIREKHYRDEDFFVQGYIDAIEEIDGKVRVMDYKTSSRFYLSEEYKLQLSIYSLLYEQEHGVMPDQVGIYFLKDTSQCEKVMNVDKEMVELAKAEVEVVHMNTESNDIRDYPKKESPLCKWRTGQCNFYEVCFGQKELSEFGVNVALPNGSKLS